LNRNSNQRGRLREVAKKNAITKRPRVLRASVGPKKKVKRRRGNSEGERINFFQCNSPGGGGGGESIRSRSKNLAVKSNLTRSRGRGCPRKGKKKHTMHQSKKNRLSGGIRSEKKKISQTT